MSIETGGLGRVSAGGSARDIGRALGRAGRDAVHRHLANGRLWRELSGPLHAARVARMTRETRARFPWIWEEIEGMADGLGLPVAEVMAWNCRGDLLASAPDGCTTVQVPGPEPLIAHNEDGLPSLRGSCFIVDAAPGDAPGFTAFCYPGSLPGHTFAVTGAGLAQAVNNLRLSGVDPAIPRMVLGRAVLSAPGLDAALDLLRADPRCGGFHFSLAECGRDRLVSVEFGGGACFEREIETPALHANHAIGMGDAAQIVTASSRDRQARGAALLASGNAGPLAILRDSGGPGLPIRRDAPDDPDCENTLATAVMHVRKDGVDWSVYDRISDTPAYVGHRARD